METKQTELEIYDCLSKPPKEALKKIEAGRQKGKSNINPQWRYRELTAAFGLCGVGWKYTIDRQWTEPGDSGEVMAFTNISLFIKHAGAWSDAIPGTGGNKLTAQETNSKHNNDEAFKMSLTDALGNAGKMIGLAAAIYAGEWDGDKYSNSGDEKKKTRIMDSAFTSLMRFADMDKIGKFEDLWDTSSVQSKPALFKEMRREILEAIITRLPPGRGAEYRAKLKVDMGAKDAITVIQEAYNEAAK